MLNHALAPAHPAAAATLRQALLADLCAHDFSAQHAHEWAVAQLTGHHEAAQLDHRQFKAVDGVSAIVDDVHRLMAMYPAARELDGVYACRGFVSHDGRPYLVVTDHYADAESVETIVGPNFRVESKPSLAFPVVTLNFQG